MLSECLSKPESLSCDRHEVRCSRGKPVVLLHLTISTRHRSRSHASGDDFQSISTDHASKPTSLPSQCSNPGHPLCRWPPFRLVANSGRSARQIGLKLEEHRIVAPRIPRSLLVSEGIPMTAIRSSSRGLCPPAAQPCYLALPNLQRDPNRSKPP